VTLGKNCSVVVNAKCKMILDEDQMDTITQTPASFFLKEMMKYQWTWGKFHHRKYSQLLRFDR